MHKNSIEIATADAPRDGEVRYIGGIGGDLASLEPGDLLHIDTKKLGRIESQALDVGGGSRRKALGPLEQPA